MGFTHNWIQMAIISISFLPLLHPSFPLPPLLNLSLSFFSSSLCPSFFLSLALFFLSLIHYSSLTHPHKCPRVKLLVSLKPKSTWVNDRAWGELTLRTEPHPETRPFSSSFNAKSHVCRAVTIQGKMPHRGRRAKPAFSAWVGFRECCKLDLIHVHTPFIYMLSFKTSVASITIFTCPFSEKLIFRTNAIKKFI